MGTNNRIKMLIRLVPFFVVLQYSAAQIGCPAIKCPANCDVMRGPDGCNHCACPSASGEQHLCSAVPSCPQGCSQVEGQDGCPVCQCGHNGVLCAALSSCLKGCLSHNNVTGCYTCSCSPTPLPHALTSPLEFRSIDASARQKRQVSHLRQRRPSFASSGVRFGATHFPFRHRRPSFSSGLFSGAGSRCQSVSCPQECRLVFDAYGCRQCLCGPDNVLCPSVPECYSRCLSKNLNTGCSQCFCSVEGILTHRHQPSTQNFHVQPNNVNHLSSPSSLHQNANASPIQHTAVPNVRPQNIIAPTIPTNNNGLHQQHISNTHLTSTSNTNFIPRGPTLNQAANANEQIPLGQYASSSLPVSTTHQGIVNPGSHSVLHVPEIPQVSLIENASHQQGIPNLHSFSVQHSPTIQHALPNAFVSTTTGLVPETTSNQIALNPLNNPGPIQQNPHVVNSLPVEHVTLSNLINPPIQFTPKFSHITTNPLDNSNTVAISNLPVPNIRPPVQRKSIEALIPLTGPERPLNFKPPLTPETPPRPKVTSHFQTPTNPPLLQNINRPMNLNQVVDNFKQPKPNTELFLKPETNGMDNATTIINEIWPLVPPESETTFESPNEEKTLKPVTHDQSLRLPNNVQTNPLTSDLQPMLTEISRPEMPLNSEDHSNVKLPPKVMQMSKTEENQNPDELFNHPDLEEPTNLEPYAPVEMAKPEEYPQPKNSMKPKELPKSEEPHKPHEIEEYFNEEEQEIKVPSREEKPLQAEEPPQPEEPPRAEAPPQPELPQPEEPPQPQEPYQPEEPPQLEDPTQPQEPPQLEESPQSEEPPQSEKPPQPKEPLQPEKQPQPKMPLQPEEPLVELPQKPEEPSKLEDLNPKMPIVEEGPPEPEKSVKLKTKEAPKLEEPKSEEVFEPIKPQEPHNSEDPLKPDEIPKPSTKPHVTPKDPKPIKPSQETKSTAPMMPNSSTEPNPTPSGENNDGMWVWVEN